MTQKCTTLNKTDTELAGEAATNAANTTLVNDIRAKLKGNYPVTKTALAIGSTPANVATGALDFTIAGVRYSKAAVAAGTAPGNDVVPQSTFGAVALDIGVDGIYVYDITVGTLQAPYGSNNSTIKDFEGLVGVSADDFDIIFLAGLK